MELFFLLSAQVVPLCFYLTVSILLLLKKKKITDVYYYSLLFALMTVGFIADFVYIMTLDEVNLPYVQSISVYKVYVISSLLPCVMLKFFFNFYRYGKYVYVIVCVFGLLIGGLNHLCLFKSAFQPMLLLQRLAVTVNVLSLSCFLYLTVLRKEESTDIVLWKMKSTLRVYVVYYVSLTNIFIYYLLTNKQLVDYTITLFGIILLHVLMIHYKRSAGKPRRPAPYPVPDEHETEMVPVFEESDSKYRISYTDTHVDIDDVKERVVDYLEKKRMFLHPNLTMEKMASDIYTNKTYLSKVINNEMHKGFRELINHYRVKEAMRIYNETQDITIEELSIMCGFNNMASFTNAFKVNTGKTPGEWCRDIKKKNK